MSIAADVESLGPPRGRDGRLRIDMGKLLSLRAEGYSLRQIGKALGVSESTVLHRLRERTKAPPDPHFSEMGRRGAKAWRRAMTRRRREAKLEVERQKAAQVQGDLLKLGLLALVADRVLPTPKKDESGTGYGP